VRLVVADGQEQAWPALGGVVAHDVRDPRQRQNVLFRKGAALAAAQLDQLRALGVGEVHLLVPDDGDLAEDVAAETLASAVVGPGVRAAAARHGQVTLTAESRGFLRVRRDVLDAVNGCDGVLVFTAEADRPTDADLPVGAVKCAPLLLGSGTAARVRQICQDNGPVIDVVPFVPRRAALVILDRFGETTRDRARTSLSSALRWYGSTLDVVVTARATVADVVAAYQEALASGADLLFAAGAAATDPADVLFDGLRQTGGAVEQIGIPADPGTACWIGQIAGRPILGLASCELFGRPGALDVLLPRILSGEPLDRALLRRVAYGGLVLGGPPRLPPYHEAPEAEAETETETVAV